MILSGKTPRQITVTAVPISPVNANPDDLPDNFDLNAKGQLDGDLQVSVKQGALACTGGLTLVDFLLEGDSLNRDLFSEKATISCSKDSILFPSTQWKYGPWISSITGEIPLKKEGLAILFLCMAGQYYGCF